jgi:hypothetical protein
VLTRLSKLVLVLALAGSIGLHWAVFQAVAWTTMVASFSRSLPLSEALEKTFDGKHPCSLCKEIAKAKQSEKKAQYPMLVKKLDLMTAKEGFVFCAPPYFWRMRTGEARLRALRFEPPTPPPRGSIA